MESYNPSNDHSCLLCGTHHRDPCFVSVQRRNALRSSKARSSARTSRAAVPPAPCRHPSAQATSLCWRWPRMWRWPSTVLWHGVALASHWPRAPLSWPLSGPPLSQAHLSLRPTSLSGPPLSQGSDWLRVPPELVSSSPRALDKPRLRSPPSCPRLEWTTSLP